MPKNDVELPGWTTSSPAGRFMSAATSGVGQHRRGSVGRGGRQRLGNACWPERVEQVIHPANGIHDDQLGYVMPNPLVGHFNPFFPGRDLQPLALGGAAHGQKLRRSPRRQPAVLQVLQLAQFRLERQPAARRPAGLVAERINRGVSIERQSAIGAQAGIVTEPGPSTARPLRIWSTSVYDRARSRVDSPSLIKA